MISRLGTANLHHYLMIITAPSSSGGWLRSRCLEADEGERQRSQDGEEDAVWEVGDDEEADGNREDASGDQIQGIQWVSLSRV